MNSTTLSMKLNVKPTKANEIPTTSNAIPTILRWISMNRTSLHINPIAPSMKLGVIQAIPYTLPMNATVSLTYLRLISIKQILLLDYASKRSMR